MAAAGTHSGPLVELMDTNSQAIRGWIDWVAPCNLPFSFPEGPTLRKFASISLETLLK